MSETATETKRGRKPGSTSGIRRSVIVMRADGNVQKLDSYCKDNQLSVGTVYLRLKKRLADSKDDAIILQASDPVLSAERQPTGLNVYAVKGGVVRKLRYQDAVTDGAELIISKHGYKTRDEEQWIEFPESFPELDEAQSAVTEVAVEEDEAESVEEESLVE